MNDDIREKLSAYLDGALSDAERRAVEVEISRSEEMRRELESLRAVSGAVKGLPKEELPAGFMARLEARRLREDAKPAREYFILPPAYRPLAFALSTAVVALVVWDKTHPSAEFVAPRVGWDGDRVAVKSAAEAPASIDVSGQLSSMGAAGKAATDEAPERQVAANAAKAFDGAKAGKLEAPSTFGKHISAPGKPLGIAEDIAPAASAGPSAGMGGGGSIAAAPAPAPAAPAAAADALEPAEGKDGAFRARNEEERSAINERLYKGFEEEKKRMGIAQILEKDDEADKKLPSGGREMMTLQASPEAAKVDQGRATVAASRGAAKAKRREAPAPAFKAIALKSAEALQAAWAAAGLPGEPPAVKFPGQMALFLAGPQGCGIVTVENRKKFIVVLYKASGFDDASARVKAVALSTKPVVVKLAE
jgi:anti-sigma factor RsiW